MNCHVYCTRTGQKHSVVSVLSSTIPNVDNVHGVAHFMRGMCNELLHSTVNKCLAKAPDVRFRENVQVEA